MVVYDCGGALAAAVVAVTVAVGDDIGATLMLPVGPTCRWVMSTTTFVSPSPPSRTISRGCGDLGGRDRARRAWSAPSPLSHPIPGRPVYKSFTCSGHAHGSGVRSSDLANFAYPACLDSIAHRRGAVTIPRIFRIMGTAP